MPGKPGWSMARAVSKADARMAAIGDVDEANSAIGVALAATVAEPWQAMLSRIQNELFDLGADLATPGEDFETFRDGLAGYCGSGRAARRAKLTR